MRREYSVSCSSVGSCFRKRLDERSQPSALLDRLRSPVSAPVVAVPAAARSTRAEPTMQPAAFSAGDRGALTGCPSPGFSAALRVHHHASPTDVQLSNGVDLQIFYRRSTHEKAPPKRV